MDNYSMMNDSSSSSSSLDGLSFILEELSHDTPVLNYILDSETDIKTLELLMKLKQARLEKRASSSS